MKRICQSVIVGVFTLFSGCIADEVGGVWLVTEKVEELASSKNYGTEVYFQAGDNWRAWASEPWLNVIPTEGKSGRNGIRLRTESANHSHERRQATLTIESGGKQETVTVWQRNEYALFDQREFTVDANGGEVKMTFDSNVDKDSLLLMYIKKDWFTWEGDSMNTRAADWHGRVRTLHVAPNTKPMERSTYFMLVLTAERRIDYQVLDTAWVRQAAADSASLYSETRQWP